MSLIFDWGTFDGSQVTVSFAPMVHTLRRPGEVISGLQKMLPSSEGTNEMGVACTESATAQRAANLASWAIIVRLLGLGLETGEMTGMLCTGIVRVSVWEKVQKRPHWQEDGTERPHWWGCAGFMENGVQPVGYWLSWVSLAGGFNLAQAAGNVKGTDRHASVTENVFEPAWLFILITASVDTRRRYVATTYPGACCIGKAVSLSTYGCSFTSFAVPESVREPLAA